MPPDIPEICIKAGCPKDGIVLDMFMGAGTVALVARNLGRSYIGCELNPEYIEIANKRLQNSDPYQPTTFKNGVKQLSLFNDGMLLHHKITGDDIW